MQHVGRARAKGKVPFKTPGPAHNVPQIKWRRRVTQELSLHQCIPKAGPRTIFNEEGLQSDRPSVRRLACGTRRRRAPRTVIGNRTSDTMLMHWRHYETYTWNSGPHDRLDRRNG